MCKYYTNISQIKIFFTPGFVLAVEVNMLSVSDGPILQPYELQKQTKKKLIRVLVIRFQDLHFTFFYSMFYSHFSNWLKQTSNSRPKITQINSYLGHNTLLRVYMSSVLPPFFRSKMNSEDSCFRAFPLQNKVSTHTDIWKIKIPSK